MAITSSMAASPLNLGEVARDSPPFTSQTRFDTDSSETPSLDTLEDCDGAVRKNRSKSRTRASSFSGDSALPHFSPSALSSLTSASSTQTASAIGGEGEGEGGEGLTSNLQIKIFASTKMTWNEFCGLCSDSRTTTGFFAAFARRLLAQAKRLGVWNPDQLYILSTEEAAVIEDIRAREYVKNHPSPTPSPVFARDDPP